MPYAYGSTSCTKASKESSIRKATSCIWMLHSASFCGSSAASDGTPVAADLKLTRLLMDAMIRQMLSG